MGLIKALHELMSLLRSIDARLKRIESAAETVASCVDNSNHRNRNCIKTGHWND